MDKKWTSGNELKYLKEVLSNEDIIKSNPFTARLEKAFCDSYGVRYAIAMNSATSAIHTALHVLGVGEGDEVITTPYSVIMDASIPIYIGAKPVFADIEFETHNIDPNSIEERITDKTKAIIAVSYHGLPYDIDGVCNVAKKYNIPVIEDNAQTQMVQYKGRNIANDADLSLFSFERTKHISTGEGGILVTNSSHLAEEARKFAGLGFMNLTSGKSKMVAITPKDFQRPDFLRHDRIGLNYRYNEFCAAVALAQFERVEEIVKLRQDIAAMYNDVFKGTKFEPQKVNEEYSHSYFSYGVKSPYYDKSEWIDFYNYHTNKGGDDFYAMMQPAYREPIMVELGFKTEYEGSCPNAEKVQKVSMLFKTNYRSKDEAKIRIDQLHNSISKY
jgi:perosamine synthetase